MMPRFFARARAAALPRDMEAAPYLSTTLDLSAVMPAPRIIARDPAVLMGLMIGIPTSLSLWVALGLLCAALLE
ncbi:hypothetical protein [Sphingobium lignivorans]|uniref:Uncharacterized protein n=1 Tax=Sphingobium lignivorans TaxID=2735886 RepID=A0ABR6NFS9_9SPHN|nr:hypothetical protein [Sphingobium lignivorans]MBB5986130.1 hypothetical protein [Sphingobium lignivorans]